MQNLMDVQTMTMSSREISKLTGKDHGSIVIRDIWNMISDLYGAEKDAANLQDKKNQQVTISDGITVTIDHRGYVFEFRLDRDHTECLLTGYSALLRMRVIQRWRELEEKQPQFHIPQTLPDALRLAAELAEETQRLTLINKEQEVEIHDLKNLFKEGMTTTQFCKMLNGVNTQQVNHWLADRNWLYNESKSGIRWRSTSYARDKYLTEHQHKISVHGADDFIRHQPVLLCKGAERIYELYRKGKAPMKMNWDGNFTHQKQVRIAS
ncbi:Rha family transcriptional regulator [Citrobacter koseri]|uniref:Rha family transcriptional regulator n=1 Tax=Citrobacter koseri TaxID=545 RepID=UPI001908A91B|nr:phage antirepressor KilAC domain-containing protein [Citrobacter koseri]MBJ9121007.1 Rha family transcriptional regulator [Citrobacter koseri]